jgi:hypothetical protein
MKPIEKNIVVVDEQGNEYEATYLKRAKGLVKNGRARFIEENKICLACPPNKILEDKEMSEKIVKTEAIEDTYQTQVSENNSPEISKFSMSYVLEQIENIAKQTEYLNQVILELKQIKVGVSGDIGAAGKSEALSSVVKCRETTNQQLLKLYEKMYDDLKPKLSLKEKALDVINRTLNNPTCSDTEKEMLSDVLDTVRHLDDSKQSTNLTEKFSEITDWAKSLNKDEFDPITWSAISESLKAQLSRSW